MKTTRFRRADSDHPPRGRRAAGAGGGQEARDQRPDYLRLAEALRHAKFRDEFLTLQWFRNRVDAKVVIATWRRHYNEVRPRSSLGYLTPLEFKAGGEREGGGGSIRPTVPPHAAIAVGGSFQARRRSRAARPANLLSCRCRTARIPA